MKSYSIDTFSSKFESEALSTEDIGAIALVDSTNFGNELPIYGIQSNYYIFNDVDKEGNVLYYIDDNNEKYIRLNSTDNDLGLTSKLVNFDKIIIFDKDFKYLSSIVCEFYYSLKNTELRIKLNIFQQINVINDIIVYEITYKNHIEKYKELFNIHSGLINYISSANSIISQYKNINSKSLSISNSFELTNSYLKNVSKYAKVIDTTKLYKNNLYSVIFKDLLYDNFGNVIENPYYLLDNNLRLFNKIKINNENNIFEHKKILITKEQFNNSLKFVNLFFTNKCQGYIIPINLVGFILYKYMYEEREWFIEYLPCNILNLKDIYLKPDYFEYTENNNDNVIMISFGSKLTLKLINPSNEYITVKDDLVNQYYYDSLYNIFDFTNVLDDDLGNLPKINDISIPFFYDDFKVIKVKQRSDSFNWIVSNELPNQITSFTSLTCKYLDNSLKYYNNKNIDDKYTNETLTTPIPYDIFTNNKYKNYLKNTINNLIENCNGNTRIAQNSILNSILNNIHDTFESNNITVQLTNILKITSNFFECELFENNLEETKVNIEELKNILSNTKQNFIDNNYEEKSIKSFISKEDDNFFDINLNNDNNYDLFLTSFPLLTYTTIEDTVINISNDNIYNINYYSLLINNDKFSISNINDNYWLINLSKENDRISFLNSFTKYFPDFISIMNMLFNDIFVNDKICLDKIYFSDYFDSQFNLKFDNDLYSKTGDLLIHQVYSKEDIKKLIKNLYDIESEEDDTQTFQIRHKDNEFYLALKDENDIHLIDDNEYSILDINTISKEIKINSEDIYINNTYQINFSKQINIQYLGLDFEFENNKFYTILSQNEDSMSYTQFYIDSYSTKQSYFKLVIGALNELLYKYKDILNYIQYKICDDGILVLDESKSTNYIISYYKLYLTNSNNTRQTVFKYPFPKNNNIKIQSIEVSNENLYIYYTNNLIKKQKIINISTSEEETLTNEDIYIEKFGSNKILIKDIELIKN